MDFASKPVLTTCKHRGIVEYGAARDCSFWVIFTRARRKHIHAELGPGFAPEPRGARHASPYWPCGSRTTPRKK
jgi:hypothetical protein